MDASLIRIVTAATIVIGAISYPAITTIQVSIIRTATPIAPQSVKLEFGGFRQIEDLSARLVAETNRWCLDMNYNYRHNPDFDST